MKQDVLIQKSIRNIKYVLVMQGLITLTTAILNLVLARFVRKSTYGFISIEAGLLVILINNVLKAGFRMALQKSVFSCKPNTGLEEVKKFKQSVINSVRACCKN
eukprot:TRINITY_DN5650_c0_g2_i7.p2 TRINITY_DN5650_c0_g2~~TRINITY_DN5650_c0_g2_i7.p2  ORF type:complete len:104 (+),score=25.06 TRINITY_DN5650_c0_g2_i7:65-376(+)